MKKKGYLLVLIFVLFLFINKETIYASETRVVSNADEFHAALADSNVSVIEVNGTINKLIGSGNDPLMISRPVTIRGGVLDLWYLGIVLGADVTFENIEINLSSTESNAIVANGYTLTLDGVTRGSNVKNDIHIFGGGIVGYSYTNIPSSGEHGEIIIKGNSKLGNIYAGNMAHSNVGESRYLGNVTITVDSTATGEIGTIYGCGGRESMGEGSGNLVYTGNEYGVDGDINVTLYDSKVKQVIGVNDNLVVTFGGSGNLATPVLENITTLKVLTGSLQPANGSSFFHAFPNLTVAENGVLFLEQYGQLSIGNFEGGGQLVLGKEQNINITGSVTGVTDTYIGHNGFPEFPEEDHTYIEAVRANKENFVFHGSNSNPSFVPVFVSNGAGGGIWTTAEEAETIIKVKTFVIEDYQVKEVDEFAEYIEMPVTVTYTEDTNGNVDVLAFVVKVNGKEAMIEYDELGYVYYRTEDLYCYTYSVDTCTLRVSDPVANTPPENGNYHISITIPGQFTEDGNSITTDATLTIGESSDGEDNGGDNPEGGDGPEGGNGDNPEGGDGPEGGNEDNPDNGDEENIPEGIWVAGVNSSGYEYTGSAIKPQVRVYDNKVLLKEKKDYTISYKNNINANDGSNPEKVPTLIVTGKGNYSGKVEKNFVIHPKQLDQSAITVDNIVVVENGSVQQPTPVIKDGKRTLRKDVHYTLEYPDFESEKKNPYKAAGEYEIWIHGKGNYVGKKIIQFTITEQKLIRQAAVSKIPNQIFQQEPVKPQVIVKYQGQQLSLGVDYELFYEKNDKVGIATVVIQGKGLYTGTKRVNFKIVSEKKENPIQNLLSIGSNSEHDTAEDVPEENKSEQQVNSSETKEVIKVTEKLTNKNIQKAKVVVSPQTYTQGGNVLKLEDIKISYDNHNVEFSIAGYENNNRKGVAIAYVKGVGDFSGMKIVKFKIKAKNLEITARVK
ncbi:MAG: hypothetical protein IKW30_01355 [Lachnospiraceae bacterium]|nr:hypothetical protein [Lachnospiraceae bacterium]